MTNNAMPATLNIDLNQTTIKSPAMYALERLHAELDGQILQNKKEAKRLAQCMMRRCWIPAGEMPKTAAVSHASKSAAIWAPGCEEGGLSLTN